MANEENYWSPEAIQARIDAYRNQTAAPEATQNQAPVNPQVAAYNAQFETAADQRTYLTPEEVVQVRSIQGANEGAARESAMEGNIMDLFVQQGKENIFDNRNAVTVAQSMGVDPAAINFEGGDITDASRAVGAFDEPENVTIAREIAQGNLNQTTAPVTEPILDPTKLGKSTGGGGDISDIVSMLHNQTKGAEGQNQLGQGGKGGGKSRRAKQFRGQ